MASTPLSLPIDQASISSPRVIICEGSGDRNFFESLIAARNLSSFYITHPIDKLHHGGNEGFEGRLRSLRLQPGFEKVTGIIIASDNDRDADESFRKVRGQIQAATFRTPEVPFITVRGPDAVTVMMLPGPNELGQLETLCLRAIQGAWPQQFQCAESYAICAGIGEWDTPKQERAKLRALISHICKKDPNTSLTYLWHGNRELVIPLNNPCFDEIVRFLSDFAVTHADSTVIS